MVQCESAGSRAAACEVTRCSADAPTVKFLNGMPVKGIAEAWHVPVSVKRGAF